MAQFFDSISMQRNPRAKFDLSHSTKLSMQAGELIPIFVKEALPGDKWQVNTELFLRMQALLTPPMHRWDATIHYFFVPNRLIWNEFEDFITRGRTGTSAPIHPAVLCDNTRKSRYGIGTLADYMGLPDLTPFTLTGTKYFNALPFRAYQLVYNEYYRDNILTPPVSLNIGSGLITTDPELDALMTIRRRCWEKDYFTSARPQPQLGPDGTVAGSSVLSYSPTSSVITTSGSNNADASKYIGTTTTAGQLGVNKTTTTDGQTGRIENISSISTTIQLQALRLALAIQKFAEKNMRIGARYSEQLFGRWGVKSSDARLNRPEYLGGGKQAVNISEVLQTAQGTNPVGTMNGHGYAVGGKNGFTKPYFCEEHGFIIGILSVLPKTSYQQGINKMWTRDDVFDYATPELTSLGEQAVLQSEVYQGAALATDPIFGYQERYGEYKSALDTVHGEFKTTLAAWHSGRIFSAAPLLNTSFVEAGDVTQRNFAITDPLVDKLLVQLYHRVDVLRQLPYHGIPSIEAV